MKVERFEDIRAWQAARDLTKEIYRLTNSGKFARDFKLRDQIRDASGSIMHNIAEGFDSSSDGEFARFLTLSRRSASEVQSELYIALDQNYISQEEFDIRKEQAESVKKQINAFITYLLQSDNRQSFRDKATKKPLENKTNRPSDHPTIRQ